MPGEVVLNTDHDRIEGALAFETWVLAGCTYCEKEEDMKSLGHRPSEE